MLDIQGIRQNFPILHQNVQGKPLVYLDNAATSQKPKSVIDALSGYYTGYNSNVHRGAHTLAAKATDAFEATRQTVQKFINAASTQEVIFTRGTTEAINLVAQSYGKTFVKKGDEVIVSTMEHHSNIVPWQLLCEAVGATLKVIPISEKGELLLDEYKKLLTPKTKIVACVYVSNALGTINPISEIIRLAHEQGAITVVDGAQASPHFEVDVQAMDCDFYAFSGHKMYAPTGIGVLYGKKELLEKMPPYMGGGEMIKEVSFEKTTFNELPYKFEAGTPNIADAVALKHAIDFIEGIGKEAIAAHENDLLAYATQQIQEIEGVKIIGTAAHKASVLSFVVKGIHHYDLGMMLDAQGVAVRTGHHCTQPLMKRLGLDGTVRASFSVYNTHEEVDVFIHELKKVLEMLR